MMLLQDSRESGESRVDAMTIMTMNSNEGIMRWSYLEGILRSENISMSIMISSVM